jgi:hypothetical protein
MKQGAERIQPESNEPRKPEAPKSAEIIYINDFAEYFAISDEHPRLLREEFDRIKTAAENPDVTINPNFSRNANFIAGLADITLSPKSLILYSVLRSDGDISSELLAGDQQVLAEVLRMEGRAADATKLEKAYPVITF